MMNNAETPERPMRPAAMPATMAAPDAAAAFRFPSSSAPVTPSPYVNRAGHSDVKFASPVAAADVKGKRLDFVESTPKRQHDQTYNDDDEDAEEASDQHKKAKISKKIPPKEDKMQTFRALTVFPTNEPMSSGDQNKAASHLRNTCLAPDLLRLKTNDRIVTTQKLGDNVPIGTPGKVVGWTSIEDIRSGLSNHIQELREMKMPGDNNDGGCQEEYEIDVSHKHAVDATPAPWYPNNMFQGRNEEEEGTVLPEAFIDHVPGIGERGVTMTRIQLPLLRVPHCRCRPAQPARLLRCHNHGPNHGRWFFTCGRDIGHQCGYFVWKTAKQQQDKKKNAEKDQEHDVEMNEAK